MWGQWQSTHTLGVRVGMWGLSTPTHTLSAHVGSSRGSPKHTQPRASVSPCMGAGLTPTRGSPRQTPWGVGYSHPCSVCPPVSRLVPTCSPHVLSPPSACLIPRRLFAQQSAAATDSCRGRGRGIRSAAHACAWTCGHQGTPSWGTRVCQGAGVVVLVFVHSHLLVTATVHVLTHIPTSVRSCRGANVCTAECGHAIVLVHAQSVQMLLHGRVSTCTHPCDRPSVWQCTHMDWCKRVHSRVSLCTLVPVSTCAHCGANLHVHASPCQFLRVAVYTCSRVSGHVEQCKRVCAHFLCRCTRVHTGLPGTYPMPAHAPCSHTYRRSRCR